MGDVDPVLLVVPVLKLIPPLTEMLLEITNLLLSFPTKLALTPASCLNHICGLAFSSLLSASASMITTQSLSSSPDDMCNLEGDNGESVPIPTLPADVIRTFSVLSILNLIDELVPKSASSAARTKLSLP